MPTSVTVTVSGNCTYVCVCAHMGVCVCLITSEECFLVGSVSVPASVSLCEPRECVCALVSVPGCIGNSLNVSKCGDLMLCGVRKMVFPCVRKNLTAHVCVACAHMHACAHTRTHTQGSVSAYLDSGSVVKSLVGGKYETSAAAFPGPVGNGG